MNIPMNIPGFFGPIWFFKVATSEAVATCQGLRSAAAIACPWWLVRRQWDLSTENKLQWTNTMMLSWYQLYLCTDIYIYIYINIYIYICRRFLCGFEYQICRERIEKWCLVDWFGGLYYPTSWFFSNPWTGKSVLNQPVSLGTTGTHFVSTAKHLCRQSNAGDSTTGTGEMSTISMVYNYQWMIHIYIYIHINGLYHHYQWNQL